MMLCSVYFFYIFVEKEIKMLELETLFMLVNAVLYEFVPKKLGKTLFKHFFEEIF